MKLRDSISPFYKAIICLLRGGAQYGIPPAFCVGGAVGAFFFGIGALVGAGIGALLGIAAGVIGLAIGGRRGWTIGGIASLVATLVIGGWLVFRAAAPEYDDPDSITQVPIGLLAIVCVATAIGGTVGFLRGRRPGDTIVGVNPESDLMESGPNLRSLYALLLYMWLFAALIVLVLIPGTAWDVLRIVQALLSPH